MFQKFFEKTIKLIKLDNNDTIKTTFIGVFRNFEIINNYLNELKTFLEEFYKSVNIDEMLKKILSKLSNEKTSLNINYDLEIGTTDIQTSNGIVYNVERVSQTVIMIQADVSIWDTNNIIVQVKNAEGIIVYPTIITKTGFIKIIFLDNITLNYKVLLI